MNLFEFVLPQKDCENITNFVYQEKINWIRDLENVKALTSGYNPDFAFLHDMADFCCKNILPQITNHDRWEKVHWWINLYEKGNYTTKHIHRKNHYSMIIIIKPALEKYCLNFHTKFATYKVEERQGLCLIFDASLEHSVDPVQSDRITIAMDFHKK